MPPSSRIGRMDGSEAPWPALPLSAWADTRATLHMWTQVVGKIRLALAPPVNHWWHVTLALTARGLTTTPMPYGAGFVELAFDFIDHRLVIETSDGRRRTVALEPKSVADFYREVKAALADLNVAVRIWPVPSEVPSPIRFDQDREHHAYDAVWAERWWRVLVQADAVFKEFRGRFLGKSSPSHFSGAASILLSRGSTAVARPNVQERI